MEQFYIDRQFGQAIFIDVEKGIVQRCYNESEHYNAKMDENYKGKHINFLNEDFIGRAMKGTYHHLRPLVLIDSIQRVEAFKSRARAINTLLSDWKTSEDKIKELTKVRDELQLQQYAAEIELTKEKERILNEHNFVM